MTDLATLAADEYLRRHARAAELVRTGTLPRAQAEAQLRPWLAIACLAGADLPEIAELLADIRVLHGTPSAADKRAQAADDICPRARRRAALATACESALARFDNSKPIGGAGVDITRGLLTLARHFNVALKPPAPTPQLENAA